MLLKTVSDANMIVHLNNCEIHQALARLLQLCSYQRCYSSQCLRNGVTLKLQREAVTLDFIYVVGK